MPEQPDITRDCSILQNGRVHKVFGHMGGRNHYILNIETFVTYTLTLPCFVYPRRPVRVFHPDEVSASFERDTMLLQPTTLILLVVVSGDAALLNRIAQRLPARRVRDALIAPAISAAPTLTEPERVDTYWKQDDSELSQRLARMLEATPSLQTPTYRPTTWAKGSKANFALAFARSRAGELRRKARNLRAANLYRCPHTSTRSPSRPRPHPKPRADQVEPPLSGGAPRYSACDGAPDIVVEWAKDEAAVALRLANPNPNP
jgi:hypothetical protein